jgi:hypothetical protein
VIQDAEDQLTGTEEQQAHRKSKEKHLELQIHCLTCSPAEEDAKLEKGHP